MNDKQVIINKIKSMIPQEHKDGLTWEEYHYGTDTKKNVLLSVLKIINEDT